MVVWFQKEKTETSFPRGYHGILNSTVWVGIWKGYKYYSFYGR